MKDADEAVEAAEETFAVLIKEGIGYGPDSETLYRAEKETAKDFLDSLSPERRDAIMLSVCGRKGLKI
jgi:hypothetical protein